MGKIISAAATIALALCAGGGASAERPGEDLVRTCGVEDLIFAVRQADSDGHWYANFGHHVIDLARRYYHDGGRLCRLSLKTGEVTALLDDPNGGVRDPQVHYDGTRILFSYRKGGQPYYHLYETGADGSGLRQLTDGPFDDIEPTYLPDGDILFCSSRCNRWVPCYYTQVALLYRCDGNGRRIRPLSANTEHENTPWVLPDGRILYQRWEYVDRSQVGYHHLWTMNPDGTGQMVYFGNLHPNTVMIDAKPVPGTDSVVASFSPGHGRNEHAGTVTLIEPNAGPDAARSARPIGKGNDFRDPYPLSPDLFLAAQGPTIVLLYATGETLTLYNLPAEWRHGRMMVHEPRPLRPRPREPIVPPQVDLAQATGRVVLENAHVGRQMQGVEPGQIRELLVLEILPKPYNMFSGMEPLSYGGTFLLERILGTVPVEADGSAYMELPAMRPVFFVALDSRGMPVKRMQSFLTVQPGEAVGCVGCHEQRVQAPRAARPLEATRRRPSPIRPIPDVPGVFDFPRDIQPILDRHCVACHDYEATPRGGPMAGGVVLSGDRGPMFSHSYFMLTICAQVSDGRNLRKSNYPPRALGSSASPVMKLLDGSHYDARPSPQETKMIRLWIDSGAAYPGTYAALGTGMIGHYARGSIDRQDLAWPSVREARQVVTTRCAACHAKEAALPESPSDNRRLVPWGEGTMNRLASGTSQRNHPAFRYSRHILYNLSRPEKSLLLLAPLAKDAGGYGVCRARPGDTAPAAGVFRTTDDADYRVLLRSVQDAKDHLEGIKRFDMPGFRPRPEYVREMKRYGLLAESFDPATDAIDVYRMDQAYWQSFWYRPTR
ncbi:MAG: hypothetical protein AMK72_13525 [Planctomycetes bacterium SM23_25]|nr:MAG: hypothetical protein AMK72_13525 [Planctomycetes bacterium SM23_25]